MEQGEDDLHSLLELAVSLNICMGCCFVGEEL